MSPKHLNTRDKKLEQAKESLRKLEAQQEALRQRISAARNRVDARRRAHARGQQLAIGAAVLSLMASGALDSHEFTALLNEVVDDKRERKLLGLPERPNRAGTGDGNEPCITD